MEATKLLQTKNLESTVLESILRLKGIPKNTTAESNDNLRRKTPIYLTVKFKIG